jgi:two-component system sensor histidine kinase CiaH
MRITLKHDGPTIRLTVSYLAIIMALCVSFSTFFYISSAGSLHVEQQTKQGSATPPSSDAQASFSMRSDLGSSPSLAQSPNVATQLSQQFEAVRTDLLHRLVLLNVVALLAGAVVSYYLARRTLGPMEAAGELQARFSFDASHELRTPLSALRTRSEVTLRKTDLTLAEAKAALKTIIEQAVKLEKLANNLLRLSRSQDTSIVRNPLLLSDVARDAMNQVVEVAQAKHITIQDDVPAVSVLGDTQTLFQVVAILLDNAIKYSQPDSTIRLEGGDEGRMGVLRVRDTGSGIDAADLPHIFERFYRADRARTNSGEQGYGLGLSIAKALIEQNKGALSVKSAVGEGSVFTIKLPRT